MIFEKSVDTKAVFMIFYTRSRDDHAEDSRCVSVRCKSPTEENESIGYLMIMMPCSVLRSRVFDIKAL